MEQNMVTAVLGLGFRASGLAGHLKLLSRQLPSIYKTFGVSWGGAVVTLEAGFGHRLEGLELQANTSGSRV